MAKPITITQFVRYIIILSSVTTPDKWLIFPDTRQLWYPDRGATAPLSPFGATPESYVKGILWDKCISGN